MSSSAAWLGYSLSIAFMLAYLSFGWWWLGRRYR
jgi:hypothetical protein